MRFLRSNLHGVDTVILFTAALVALYVALPRGVITYNLSSSVPIGLYRAVPQEKASYITFCLKKEHNIFSFYEGYCSPEHPDGMPILKRVRKVHKGGSITVDGDVLGAIDSRILGPIEQSQQRGYWRALLVF